jgi:hypothetical protein
MQISPHRLFLCENRQKNLAAYLVDTTTSLSIGETIDKSYVKQQVKWLQKSETIVIKK